MLFKHAKHKNDFCLIKFNYELHESHKWQPMFSIQKTKLFFFFIYLIVCKQFENWGTMPEFLWTVKPIFFDLTGHCSRFDIDEHCQSAKANQPKNVHFKSCQISNICQDKWPFVIIMSPLVSMVVTALLQFTYCNQCFVF